MIALIDADIVRYRIGFTTEADSEGIARARTNETVETILNETQATEYELWLSDAKENNFRYQIFPAYKGNRVQPKPKHFNAIGEHLVKEWGARFAYGMEADDALGISQDKDWEYMDTDLYSTVICSIDKDLLQIPGKHYNFVKKEWEEVSAWEGLKWFYSQILIGDVSDNIKGCAGIGPKKAEKALDQVPIGSPESSLLKSVYSLYQRQEKTWSQEEIIKHIQLVGSLLKIKQSEDELQWDSLSCSLMEELRLSFTPQKVVESTPSTELTTQAAKTLVGSASNGSVPVPSYKTANDLPLTSPKQS